MRRAASPTTAAARRRDEGARKAGKKAGKKTAAAATKKKKKAAAAKPKAKAKPKGKAAKGKGKARAAAGGPEGATTEERLESVLLGCASAAPGDALVEQRVRALALARVCYGGASPEVTGAVCHLAQAYLASGMPAQAWEHASRALQRLPPGTGADLSVNVRCVAGEARLQLGETALADSLLDEARRENEAAHGPDAASNCPIYANLAGVRARQGRLEEAVELWTRVWEIREASLGMMHPAMAEVYLGLARCHYQAGDDANAQASARQALDASDAGEGGGGGGTDGPAAGEEREPRREAADAAALLAASLRRSGEYAGSVAYSERALAALTALDGRHAAPVLDLRREVAAAHVQLEQFELAASQLRLVLASQESVAAGRLAVALTRKRLAEVYMLGGNDRRALLEFHACRDALERKRHPAAGEVRRRVAALEQKLNDEEVLDRLLGEP